MVQVSVCVGRGRLLASFSRQTSRAPRGSGQVELVFVEVVNRHVRKPLSSSIQHDLMPWKHQLPKLRSKEDSIDATLLEPIWYLL